MARRWLRREREAPAPPPVPSAVRLVPAPACAGGLRDAAMALAREVLAPPPLDRLAADTMLAVASAPGKIPEEWQDKGAWPFWIAWPHAVGAVHAEEMTAAQLRAILAAREGT
jgi:hypothetical protein